MGVAPRDAVQHQEQRCRRVELAMHERHVHALEALQVFVHADLSLELSQPASVAAELGALDDNVLPRPPANPPTAYVRAIKVGLGPPLNPKKTIILPPTTRPRAADRAEEKQSPRFLQLEQLTNCEYCYEVFTSHKNARMNCMAH